MKKKTYFITELASTHGGNHSNLSQLIKLHLNTKSDFLKFQIFKTKNLFLRKNKNFNHFKKIEISFNSWKKFINAYKDKTKIILEPFDSESYFFCKKFKKKVLLKISASECQNIGMINDALKNFKKVFLNISGLELQTIKEIIETKIVKKHKKKIVIMYGFQNYPTLKKKLRMGLFDYFKKKKISSGYADHSKYGINKNVIDVCKFAISKNCEYVEKHVCLDLKKRPLDFESSINIESFDKFTEKVNNKSKFRKFKYSKTRSFDEKKYSLTMHKFAFSNVKIKKGSKITLDTIKCLRSSSNNEGISQFDIYKKKFYAKVNISKNSQIFSNMISVK